MKFLMLFVFLISAELCAAQPKDMAVGKYAENGSLVSISNLSGLSECAPASVMGKIGKVKVEESAGHASVKTDNGDVEIAVPLDRLKPEARSAIFKQLVRKKTKVRIAGYRCKSGDPITAFSIDRIY